MKSGGQLIDELSECEEGSFRKLQKPVNSLVTLRIVQTMLQICCGMQWMVALQCKRLKTFLFFCIYAVNCNKSLNEPLCVKL